MDQSYDMECVIQNPQCISGTSVIENQLEGSFSDSCTFNSLICDLSDEEISTKKENHLRLGPEDLNDTIPYDY